MYDPFLKFFSQLLVLVENMSMKLRENDNHAILHFNIIMVVI